MFHMEASAKIARRTVAVLSRVSSSSSSSSRGLSTATPTIPGPEAYPLIGCLPDWYKRVGGFELPHGPKLLQTNHHYYLEHGPVFRVRLLGNEQHVHICHPDDILKVYRSEGPFPPGALTMDSLWMSRRWMQKRGFTHMEAFMTRGESWRDIRRILQEDIISPKVARTYLPHMNEALEAASENFQSYSEAPEEFSYRTSFDMFASVVFGVQLQTAAGKAIPEDLAFIEKAKRKFALLAHLIFKSHLSWRIFSWHPLLKEFDRLSDETYAYSSALVQRSLDLYKDTDDSEITKPYLVRLLQGGKLSREQAEQSASVLLEAGVDTTGSVMNWSVLLLACYPEMQDRLRQEVKSVLGGQSLTADAAAAMNTKLPYLKAFVREVHRMYPTSGLVTMRPSPCDLEIQGYSIPEGQLLGLQTYSIQNDPQHVENPHVFDPERWLPEAVAARKGTPSEILDHKILSSPFSFGARMCLGARVADLERYAAICRLVQDWEFVVREGEPPFDIVQPLMTRAMPFPKLDIRRLSGSS